MQVNTWARQIAICVTGALLLLFGSQMRGCAVANVAKTGTVVDADTGKRVAGVTVIASAHFYADGIFGGAASNYPYRYITHTDARGEFIIPMQWTLRLALPGTNAREDWLVTALKPAYVLDGDEIAWNELDRNGRATHSPPSTVQSPGGTYEGFEMRLDPLRIRKADLTLGQFATYYRNIQRLGDPSLNANVAQEDADLRVQVSDFLTPKVCALDRTEAVSPGVAEAILFFAIDRPAVDRAFRDEVLRSIREVTGDPLTYRGEQICELMKTGGGHQ